MENKNIHEGHRQKLYDFIINSNGNGHEIYLIEAFLTYIISRKDVNPLAHKIFDKFKSFKNFVNAPPEKLGEIKELSKTAIKRICVFSVLMQKAIYVPPKNILSNELAVRFQPYFSNKANSLQLFLLDNSNKLINTITFATKEKQNQFEFSKKIQTALEKHKNFQKILAVCIQSNLTTLDFLHTANIFEDVCLKLNKTFLDFWIVSNNQIFNIKENKQI